MGFEGSAPSQDLEECDLRELIRVSNIASGPGAKPDIHREPKHLTCARHAIDQGRAKGEISPQS